MVNNTAKNDNLYNMAHWGEGYFTINQQGEIEIAKTNDTRGVPISSIVQAANRAGLQLPLLIRFTDILHDRINKIYSAFNEAISENGYGGSYQLVYPIKVNQEFSVVRELLRCPEHSIGLEAGSKPELMGVIGLLGQVPSTIVCNGYKDNVYIRTALIAQQMGHTVFIVIEKRSELDIILQESECLNIKPKLGIRVRLTTTGAGKWQNSGGLKSKFGLNSEQVLDLVTKLKDNNSLDCLQVIHCHLGSQVADIHDIHHGIQEIARYYVNLRRLQAPITTIDVGGGLAVDYEGSHSTTDCSMNYSIKEYATHILLALRPICEEAQVPEPNLISESGRALVAHHAVLVTNITDVEIMQTKQELPSIGTQDSYIIRDICDTYNSIATSKASEIYHYATLALEEAHSMFKHGVLNLEEKAKVEQFFTAICYRIRLQLDEANPGDKELLNQINERLAAKVFCNLSFFQSLPDAWAISQIFPVVPISHLYEDPCMHSVLQDLTCDSDGTIKKYTGQEGVDQTLLLPRYDEKNPYLLAFFLVGAYQEILGNLHNLFGDTNSLDVTLLEDGNFTINDLTSGDTVANVLQYAHFDTKKLLLSYEKQLIHANLSKEKIQIYLNELRSIFTQFTYLDSKK